MPSSEPGGSKRKGTAKTNHSFKIVLPAARAFASNGGHLLEASPGCSKDVHQVWLQHFARGPVLTGTHFPNWDGSKRGLIISAAKEVTVAATWPNSWH